MSKKCIICNKEFKRRNQNFKWWATAKYCSRECYKKRIVGEDTKRKMSVAKLGNKNCLGYKHTDETRRKVSNALKGNTHCKGKKLEGIHREKVLAGLKKSPHQFPKGEKPWNYIVDRTLVRVGDRSINDGRYKEWRSIVKNRDGWKCKISNNDCSDKLEAHHILTWRNYPELRYEVNNGITLCHAHHPRKREDEVKLAPFFQGLVATQVPQFQHP